MKIEFLIQIKLYIVGFTKKEGYLWEKIKVNCREAPISDPIAQ